MAANICLLKFKSCRDGQNPGQASKLSAHIHLHCLKGTFRKVRILGIEGPQEWTLKSSLSIFWDLWCCRHLIQAAGMTKFWFCLLNGLCQSVLDKQQFTNVTMFCEWITGYARICSMGPYVFILFYYLRAVCSYLSGGKIWRLISS